MIVTLTSLPSCPSALKWEMPRKRNPRAPSLLLVGNGSQTVSGGLILENGTFKADASPYWNGAWVCPLQESQDCWPSSAKGVALLPVNPSNPQPSHGSHLKKEKRNITLHRWNVLVFWRTPINLGGGLLTTEPFTGLFSPYLVSGVRMKYIFCSPNYLLLPRGWETIRMALVASFFPTLVV